jgi:SAM-dependent methyltransferase
MEPSSERSRAFYRHLGAAGLASRTKPEWDHAILRALIALLPTSGDILDVGCGYGRIAIPLAERGYRVTGLDISPQLLRAARRDARARARTITFDEGSMTALPYAAESFDACICLWSAFNELLDPEEQVKALREMRRALRAFGVGIVEGSVFTVATDDDVRTGRRRGTDMRLEADVILGRRQLRYVHDEATLLAVARAAELVAPRVEIQDWAGRPRQLLLFSR